MSKKQRKPYPKSRKTHLRISMSIEIQRYTFSNDLPGQEKSVLSLQCFEQLFLLRSR